MIKIDGCDYFEDLDGGKIFITSDLHFCHNRDFLYEPRGFNSIEEHNEVIIKLWNETVGENDTVFILGDLMLNDNVAGINELRRLNGYLFVVAGNHDSDTRIELYKNELSWKIDSVQYAYRLKYHGYNFFLTHYPTLTSNNDYDKLLKRKTINLCGHSHVSDPFADWDKGLIFHTELDTNNNKPWLLDDIIKKIEEKVKHG